MKKNRTRTGPRRNRAKARTAGPGPVIVCRCEDVTEDEIRQAIREGADSLEAVKRVKRTGMGHCQGRGCLRTIARMLEEETGRPVADQRWPRPRPPLKPLPLGMLGGRGQGFKGPRGQG